MAQPPPPATPDPPRPLPRRAMRPPSARANRPPFGVLDAVWTVGLAALAVAVSAATGHFAAGHPASSLAGAGTAGALYLLGWRARDRAAGVTAGLLAATCLPFLQTAALSPQSAPFTLLSVAALFAFVAGSSLASLALAAVATLVRPDGLLLGLLLLGMSLAQGRKRAWLGALLFFLPVAAGWAAQTALLHLPPSLPRLGFQAAPTAWLITPASLLLLWFLLPFCAELSEPMRRARWLPVVLWVALCWVSASALSLTNPAATLLPLMAGLFALAGGGLSRLLPTLAGELPGPGPRYVLATLAVLALVGLHLRLETPLNTPAVTAPGSR